VRLNHVTLYVSDMERSVAFYERLGLTKIVADGSHYTRFVCPDGDETLSLLAAGEGEASRAPSASIHFECEDIDDRVAELEQAGLEFELEPTDQPYLWREAILRDPDGNAVFLFRAGENRLNPPWRVE
jgi:catechol 2,3-dioxygenase-like lactoylglutathione lyase family enzyme